jgi:hypothetical protein
MGAFFVEIPPLERPASLYIAEKTAHIGLLIDVRDVHVFRTRRSEIHGLALSEVIRANNTLVMFYALRIE